MSRSSRKNQWANMRDAMVSRAENTKGVEARETMPEKACGKCKQFSENAYYSDGRGSCKMLKAESDISVEPVVSVLEGDAGYITFFNSDGKNCDKYQLMALIDTDATECADPEYRRSQRQMGKLNS